MSRMHRHRLKCGPHQRRWQFAAAFLANAHLPGFWQGRIYSGGAKAICLPGLNCYACPGALGACPLGALQTVLGHQRFPFYVLGLLIGVGTLLGRAVCGLLCPFGLVQDLLRRLPFRKRRLPARLDRTLRWMKNLVLLVLVVGLPTFASGAGGVAPPTFCKWLCPAGTLGGALPLMTTDPSPRGLAGALFGWKLAVLLVLLALATILPRPFCRYLCPLGAFYGLFNRVSLYQLHVDHARCVDCGGCARACPMALDARREAASAECIRCGACSRACPTAAITQGFRAGAARNDVVQSTKPTP